jgi:tripeptide aminopeptidase
MSRLPIAVTCLLLLPALTAVPQPLPADDPLLSSARVQAVRDAIRAREPETIETQIALCQIPAPPFGETARGLAIRDLFQAAGLSRVRIDEVGNVIGERPGIRPGPVVVVSAHLDTVFPRGTKTRVSRHGTRLSGPGIGDDCRGLAVLVAIARVLGASGIETGGPVHFVATVGEEGLGDLRGVRHLVESAAPAIGRFISLDGAGLGIVARSVGSHRYRVVFTGPGGHSYGSFGMASPIGALGRAVAAIDGLTVPARPKTTFNVGRIGGGTSVNSIAAEAWMEVDLRSSGNGSLEDLDRQFHDVVTQAVADENLRWGGRETVTVAIARTGTRPAGEISADDPLVQRTTALTAGLGEAIGPGEGSTDANVPMSLGIPAITIGAGGQSRGVHSPREEFDTTGSALGSERALLVTLAAAEAAP